MKNLEGVKEVVKNFGCGFSCDDWCDNETWVSFATRQNGNVMYGEYSEVDYDNASQLGRKLMEVFNDVGYEIETTDEWVTLYVNDLED